MDFMGWLWEALRAGVPMLAVLLGVVLALAGINTVLRRRWRSKPELQFRFQLIMLALTLAGLIALLVALPVSETLRGQLLSLLGILLSASIALASTTFIGNVMAGVMLRLIQNARPGDFISVGDLSGRITEMDLLHTELQTEDRDLVTVPNLLMVTQPLRRVRASGTIVSCEVSLGYDVPRKRIASLLVEASAAAGLEEGFVQVRQLGDFSVTYRVAGLLSDTTHLISTRSKLREAVLDHLHGADIEIVSPNFMNTRALGENQRTLPQAEASPAGVEDASSGEAEAVAFDKADEAASVEQLRSALKDREAALEDEKDKGRREAGRAELDTLGERIEQAETAQREAES